MFMKKIMFFLLCILTSNVFADDDLCYYKDSDNICPCETALKNYYFLPCQLHITNDQIYVNFDGKLVPVYSLQKDSKGYYLKLWEDYGYCPKCEKWTWSYPLNCCLSPPDICPYSCQLKYKTK